MATISKFYLHDVATPNTGTMPGAGNAFVNNQPMGASLIGGGDVTGDASGARTARDATDVIGTTQVGAVTTFNAVATDQTWGIRRFVSRPLAAQTIPFGTKPWPLSYAAAESNTNAQFRPCVVCYCWRPSTGAIIGTTTSGTGGVQNSSFHQQQNPNTVAATEQALATAVNGIAGSPTDLAILDGDILVIEVFCWVIPQMAVAYNGTFYYDGTTEASATSCASFVTPPAPLTLLTAATPGPVWQNRRRRVSRYLTFR